MPQRLKITHLLLLSILLLSSCNLPFGNSLSEADAVRTSAAQTVEVLRTQAAGASVANTLPPINTETPKASTPVPGAAVPATKPPLPSMTPPNTVVPTKDATFTKVPTSTFVPIPCDRADFVADVTIPDNSYVAPGATFTKTWALKNSGSCTWTTGYSLVYASGEQMGGQAVTSLPGNVLPGQSINLSVNLTSPTTAGSHTGYWRLQNANGGAFGWGINGDQAFWVLINSGTTSATGTSGTSGFVVTSANISVSPTSLTTTLANCQAGVNYIFTGNITASGTGTVTYEWRKTDGTVMASDAIEFTGAATKSVSYTYTFIANTIGSNASQLQLYINNPNHQLFSSGGTFILTCN